MLGCDACCLIACIFYAGNWIFSHQDVCSVRGEKFAGIFVHVDV